jgi:hypothetical protein
MTLNDYTTQPSPALASLLEHPDLPQVALGMLRSDDHSMQFQVRFNMVATPFLRPGSFSVT